MRPVAEKDGPCVQAAQHAAVTIRRCAACPARAALHRCRCACTVRRAASNGLPLSHARRAPFLTQIKRCAFRAPSAALSAYEQHGHLG
ncbi:hypothetical protein C6P79_11400 [Burkholderia multivorans]|nr:hypothetical protein C6P79_11400 [Burkholderia multivorans]